MEDTVIKYYYRNLQKKIYEMKSGQQIITARKSSKQTKIINYCLKINYPKIPKIKWKLNKYVYF